MSGNSDTVKVIICLPLQIKQLVKGFELIVAVIFVLVVSDMFQGLAFQLIKLVTELGMIVGVKVPFSIGFVLKLSYSSS